MEEWQTEMKKMKSPEWVLEAETEVESESEQDLTNGNIKKKGQRTEQEKVESLKQQRDNKKKEDKVKK